MPEYAELQVTSNFSFLRGASHPEELVVQAEHLGLRAIAVTDHNSLAGIVRAHVQAKQTAMPFVVGARLDLSETDGLEPGAPPTPALPHKGGGSHASAPLPLVGRGRGWGASGKMPPANLSFLAWPTDRAAYGRLCRLLTLGQRRAGKGQCHLTLDDVAGHC